MKKCNFNSKNTIAIIITTVSSSIVIIVTCFSLGKKDFELIASSLFPLIGTWMGAIIAYYFAKENFDAAASQYNKVIDKLTPDQKLSSTPIVSAMKLIKDARILQFEQYKGTQIKDIIQNPTFSQFNRFLFFVENKCKYIIHRSTFDRIISNEVVKTTPNLNLTLEEILKLEDESIKGYIDKGIEFISVDCNLLDARNLIINNKFCLDVIVTANGKRDEEAIGWITDVIISEKIKN